jgi:hypothetical protein
MQVCASQLLSGHLFSSGSFNELAKLNVMKQIQGGLLEKLFLDFLQSHSHLPLQARMLHPWNKINNKGYSCA